MPEILDVDGSPLAPESVRMLEYLRTRSQEMSASAIREKIRKAAEELEGALGSVTATQARLHPMAGKWSIAEVVDHIAQTQIRGTEELRHLLAGRRPPLPPVYEALRSGAGQWAPWNLLVEELQAANHAMVEVLDGAADSISSDAPTVRTVMVALRKMEEERTEPQIYFAELNWKEYALLQRLHLLDHRTQVKKLHASIANK
jgi:DinB family protein